MCGINPKGERGGEKETDSIISFCFQGNQIYSCRWNWVEEQNMHANALKCKHKAHAHTCVLCCLTSCQRGREFCTRLNGRNTLRLECVEVCFPPPQQQSAGEDKLLHSASLCCVSHFSVTAAVSTSPTSIILFASPLATSLSSPRLCLHPREKSRALWPTVLSFLRHRG